MFFLLGVSNANMPPHGYTGPPYDVVKVGSGDVGPDKGNRWQDMISSEFDRLVALAGEVDRRSHSR